MTSLLTAPVAATLVAIDQADGATLTEIARATGKPVSTIQRSVQGLVGAGVLVRESPRGRLVFAPDAPRRALRELADWRLGTAGTTRLTRPAQAGASVSWPLVPATIQDAAIRRAWPQAIGSIVATYHPRRVILFGSQARGDAQHDSDVDLLVVFDDDRDRRERRVGIRRVLGGMPFAKDVLVASTADLDHPAAGTAVGDAVREGIIVYER